MNTELIKAQMVEDFKLGATEHLSDGAVTNAIQEIEQIDSKTLKAAKAYGANGSLASLVVYVKAQCGIHGGKVFNGGAWGASFPGGGALFGDVYLAGAANLNELYAGTSSFTFTATPVYTAFYFFDRKENLLGHFQAGSVSTVTGTGGGAGNWS